MRVLVIEDRPAMADAVERGLMAEGFAVDVSADGVDGLWRAREFSYDVIVLDIMLPGINGYELCRTLRSEGYTTPILMLTAKDGEYDIAEGLELGADDFLTKPFSFVELVARLRALARRAGPMPTSHSIEAGPLTIDTFGRRCLVDGHAVDLTPREYTLLETLARKPGVPFSRQELLNHAWGADHESNSNLVDVYVGYVRRKLSAETDLELIETIRGVGYRLLVER